MKRPFHSPPLARCDNDNSRAGQRLQSVRTHSPDHIKQVTQGQACISSSAAGQLQGQLRLQQEQTEHLYLTGRDMNDDHALPGTELIYQRDSSLRAIEATVVGGEVESRLIALDRTVVFPGGGGQPSDEGVLTRLDDGRRLPVIAARK